MNGARLAPGDHKYLTLLKFSPFEQRERGGWRFGTRRIAASVAERLIASGRAEILDRQLHLKPREAST